QRAGCEGIVAVGLDSGLAVGLRVDLEADAHVAVGVYEMSRTAAGEGGAVAVWGVAEVDARLGDEERLRAAAGVLQVNIDASHARDRRVGLEIGERRPVLAVGSVAAIVVERIERRRDAGSAGEMQGYRRVVVVERPDI